MNSSRVEEAVERMRAEQRKVGGFVFFLPSIFTSHYVEKCLPLAPFLRK